MINFVFSLSERFTVWDIQPTFTVRNKSYAGAELQNAMRGTHVGGTIFILLISSLYARYPGHPGTGWQ